MDAPQKQTAPKKFTNMYFQVFMLNMYLNLLAVSERDTVLSILTFFLSTGVVAAGILLQFGNATQNVL